MKNVSSAKYFENKLTFWGGTILYKTPTTVSPLFFGVMDSHKFAVYYVAILRYK